MGRSKDFPDSAYTQKEIIRQVAEEREALGSADIEKLIAENKKRWKPLRKNLDFITLCQKLRDEIVR